MKLIIDKPYLTFSAAHFLVGLGKCARIHGHNYRVFLTLGGTLEDDSSVLVDFSEVKKKLQTILREWDHKILVPTKSRYLSIETNEEHVEITTSEDRYFLLPRSDVMLIDFPAASCEYLTIGIYEKTKKIWPQFDIQVVLEETPGSKTAYGDF